MKSGDRNTSFFHKFASYRRKRNRVDRLVDDSGKVVNSNENLLRVATDYFKKLYQSNGPSNHDQIFEGITSCIDEDMNGKLDEVFTNEEVLVALKSMSPLKVSGEDGLGVVFYQRFWHIVGQEVSRFCFDMLNGKIQDLESLVTFVRSYKFEFGNSFLNLNRPIPSTSVGWKPPSNEWVKINVDACCPLSKDKAFSGAIIRNYKGSVLGSCIKFQHGFSSVFMAEAKAAVHGLSFAAELGFHHVILESDSRSLIQKLNSTADDSSAIRPVFSDIKNLARRFVECIFHFTTRDNNQAAHAVAAMGKNLISDTSWIEDVPPEVLSLVEADRRNISAS
ncbi:hypothetical protein GQ457_10G004920 [Hibiscus cannabinus]